MCAIIKPVNVSPASRHQFGDAELVGDLSAPADGVTTVVLSYNCLGLLEEAVESALAQNTTRPHRIWIHDDASTDGSDSYIRGQVRKRPDQVAGILRNTNLGSQRRRIRQSVYGAVPSRYIASLDGDDVWTDPFKLHKQCSALDAAPTAAFSTHSCRMIGIGGATLGVLDLPGPHRSRISFSSFVVSNPIYASSVVIRRDAYRRLPLMTSSAPRLQDWELWALLALEGEVLVLSDEMAAYRSHDSPTGKWPISECLAADAEVRRSVSEWARGKHALALGAARSAASVIRPLYRVSPTAAHTLERLTKGALELPAGNLRIRVHAANSDGGR